MFRCVILMSCLIIQIATQSKCPETKYIEEFSCVMPSLEGKYKGENGKIGVIGGSIEYTGAPYFAAISALKAGADLVYVITTQAAAPVIKSYSPELIVYPFLHKTHRSEIIALIAKMDVIVIGPGLGREQATMSLIYEIIQHCRELLKPLVIDADGLYAVSKNMSVIYNYPKPGIILTPNHVEALHLKNNAPAVSNATSTDLYINYWGDNVSVLVKGKEDSFHNFVSCFRWQVKEGGSGRRAGGQGDILAGVLGTFYNWSINSSMCPNYNRSCLPLAQSFAANVAAHFTRRCNLLAYNKYGRSMTASDMLGEIHNAFDIFN